MGLSLQTQSPFLSTLFFLLNSLYEARIRGLKGGIKESRVTGLIFLFYPRSQMKRLPLNKRSKVLCRKKNRQMLDKDSLCWGKAPGMTRVFVIKCPVFAAVFLISQECIYCSLVGNDQQNLQKNTAWISFKW